MPMNLMCSSWTSALRSHLEEATSAMTCPLCQIANLVVIDMNVNERKLRLHSCSRCETSWWKADGEHVGLSRVIDAATVRKSA